MRALGANRGLDALWCAPDSRDRLGPRHAVPSRRPCRPARDHRQRYGCRRGRGRRPRLLPPTRSRSREDVASCAPPCPAPRARQAPPASRGHRRNSHPTAPNRCVSRKESAARTDPSPRDAPGCCLPRRCAAPASRRRIKSMTYVPACDVGIRVGDAADAAFEGPAVRAAELAQRFDAGAKRRGINGHRRLSVRNVNGVPRRRQSRERGSEERAASRHGPDDTRSVIRSRYSVVRNSPAEPRRHTLEVIDRDPVEAHQMSRVPRQC